MTYENSPIHPERKRGVIQYLTNERVTWDNTLIKTVALCAALSLSTGTKQEAVRSSRVRARSRNEYGIETDFMPEPELTPGEEIREFNRLLDSTIHDPQYIRKEEQEAEFDRERTLVAKKYNLSTTYPE